DLPGARRAEVDLVRSVGDHPARPAGQLGAVSDPPEKPMGIEKNPHSNRFCSSFGSGPSKSDATVMRPRAAPGTLRTTRGAIGTILATGRPALASVISSPRTTLAMSRERDESSLRGCSRLYAAG